MSSVNRRILEIRTLIREKNYRWTAGLTPLVRLPEEKRKKYLGYIPDLNAINDMRILIDKIKKSIKYKLKKYTYPLQWDWRDVNGHNWTTSVKDQGECGSCVAFATVSAVESYYKILKRSPDLNIDLSEADLFFCGCGECCERGWIFTGALRYIQESGLPSEDSFPYVGTYVPCPPSSNKFNRYIRINGYRQIYDSRDGKEYLYKRGPLIVGMKVFEDFFYYKEGVYQYTSGSFYGFHAIAVIGYDDNKGYWICKNSWGSNWGENGWFKIAYEECGIGVDFCFFAISM